MKDTYFCLRLAQRRLDFFVASRAPFELLASAFRRMRLMLAAARCCERSREVLPRSAAVHLPRVT